MWNPVYGHVIGDVIGKLRENFVNQGVDDAVLNHLREQWELKLIMQPADVPIPPGGEPERKKDDDEPDLNEDDDEEEEDENIKKLMLAQYVKVDKPKRCNKSNEWRWKCTLKDGILHLNNRDILFSKAQGDFDY